MDNSHNSLKGYELSERYDSINNLDFTTGDPDDQDIIYTIPSKNDKS